MFRGGNKIIVNKLTMMQIVQEWLDDNLGDDSPRVTDIKTRWSKDFEIVVRGESADILQLVENKA
jgi:hypothetical protein